MEQVAVYCRGVRCGDAVLRADGARAEICVRMRDPGDGLYRAVLEGERGELPLGVLEPQNGELLLRRRPARRELERMGTVRCVRAVCSFLFDEKQVWNETDDPSQLLRSADYRCRLTRCSRAWWRRGQGSLMLALPLREDTPFPLESLFCFARVEHVEDTLCAVYAFDEREMPLLKRERE
ncbi:MAG: hypothetical protein IKM11_01065 [Oscillospiraceae bacterium]|nr:hypothetical protein [Oscillospiraceae bacterium]